MKWAPVHVAHEVQVDPVVNILAPHVLHAPLATWKGAVHNVQTVLDEHVVQWAEQAAPNKYKINTLVRTKR